MIVKVEKLWATENAKSVSKKTQKLPLFFRQKWPKKLQKLSQHGAQLHGAPSNNAKTLAFQGFLYRQDSKIYPLSSKKSENWNFLSPITRRKKFRLPKIWNMIGREAVRVFIQKSDKNKYRENYS